MNDAVLLGAVEAASGATVEATRFVHDHPELGHEERACAAYLVGVLERAGFEVERPLAGMETAFRGVLEGVRPGRAVGVVALYDAVPAVRPDGSLEPVHSCGHGPISGGVVGAALALASQRDAMPGTFVVVGCPADEIHAPLTASRGGGKALSTEAGVWDELDAVLYAHPEFVDTVQLRSRWMRRHRLSLAGRRSLREGVLEGPLDAARALLDACATLPRDAMLERLRLDGDVEEGAGLVLEADLLVFADEEDGLEELAARVRAAVPGGSWHESTVSAGIRPHAAVRSAVAEAFRAAGRAFVADPPPLPFATDFGNVSRRVPAALIGVGRPGGWAFHTDEGKAQFASAEGEECALAIARILALAAGRLLEPAA